MPTFVHGKTSALWAQNTRVSDFGNSIDFSADVDTSDVTVFDNGWKSFVPGLAAATVALGGFYEASVYQSLFENTTILGADNIVTTYLPAGDAAVGNLARLLPVTESNLTTSSPVGDIVAFSLDLMGEGSVGIGSVLHPYTVDTNTTTGTAKDESAATSTGWIAHLHVYVVAGGSWVVTVQDSADGSSGWATIATSGAYTTYGAERMRSAAATTTVKRYIRYVATRTGGTGGDYIGFLLAFARNY